MDAHILCKLSSISAPFLFVTKPTLSLASFSVSQAVIYEQMYIICTVYFIKQREEIQERTQNVASFNFNPEDKTKEETHAQARRVGCCFLVLVVFNKT